MGPSLVVLLLSLMLGIQPITTDLYLPALPELTRGFGAAPGQAQLTLTSLLLAFGISQLGWGPLADRFGRRPVLLTGVALYTLASVGCALAGSLASLLVWRAVQGAAMGAAVMGARAIVRDLYEPQQGARTLSMALGGLGVIACVSAPLGGWVSDALGWRWALAVLAVFGAALFALLAARFTETLPPQRRAPLNAAALVRSWATILRNRRFQAASALAITSYAGLFTFLASSPFVFMQVLGLSGVQYGLALFSISAVYIVGTFICRRLLVRLGMRRAVMLAGAVTLLAVTSMALLALAGVRSVWAILVPFWLYMLAHGVHQPCGQAAAVAPFPHAAGAASALNGFLMMVVAFLMGAWLGQQAGGSVRPLVLGVWFWGSALALVAWTLIRRHGEAPGA
ncbi:Bcr/CflA family efflux MFS transporter [Ramlibacter rhizophilus]|uniref:Bcr/CflA family efflux transporter n=2 Tax=Ramlibacter rhizophilus TaxID=1781167 RepID=A0A4Z0C1F3_9BURK|nr:Bcr/CflA family efflux MFS transporter [Ramlibacter rhizophilus]